MTQYPKRIIEVDLPIKRTSTHVRREESIRHGHVYTLRICQVENAGGTGTRPYATLLACSYIHSCVLTE